MQTTDKEKEESVEFLTPLDLEYLESNQLGYLFWDRRSPSVKQMQKGQFVHITEMKPKV